MSILHLPEILLKRHLALMPPVALGTLIGSLDVAFQKSIEIKDVAQPGLHPHVLAEPSLMSLQGDLNYQTLRLDAISRQANDMAAQMAFVLQFIEDAKK